MVFLPQEVIAKKRDGKKLSGEEISLFIDGFTKGKVSDAQAAAFAMAIYFQQMDIDERVSLTMVMRDSGEVLVWDLDGPVVDKHSTGGVGDNVSLMLAPILAACEVYVPMISGRGLGHTGGTLDKFDAIPGYCATPDNALFHKTVSEVGCAIIGQTDFLAPADRALYALRDVTATVENISLITASILSKKLAAGLDVLILDVKCGSGAFMKTFDDAKTLAQSLVKVANGAGMNTSALITDMNQPLASAAGNGLEMQNAVEFLTGDFVDPRLEEVTLGLAAKVLLMAKKAGDEKQGFALAKTALKSGKALEKFAKMVSALGGPNDFVEQMHTYLMPAPIIHDVFIEKSGIISSIDTKKIGMAVVELGGGRTLPTDRIDLRVGFDNLAMIGSEIDNTKPVARVHAHDEASASRAAIRLNEAYNFEGQLQDNPNILPNILPIILGAVEN